VSDEKLPSSEKTVSLDDVVHQKNRLGILAILHEGRKVEFGYLKEALDLTGGNLSQHLSVLEKSGLVKIDKGYDERRAMTWLSMTRTGAKALREEVEALKKIVARFDQTNPN
jgi:DNA-binding MarR family transcriptional regulator